MKIGKNSWHAKLNEYVYGGYYVRHATNLCPYFWGTILAITASPFVAICKSLDNVELPSVDIPSVDIPDVNINLPNIDISEHTWYTVGKVVAIGIALLVSYGLYGLGEWVGWDYFLIGAGILGATFGGIIAIVLTAQWLGNKYNDWRDDHPKEYKEPKPNILWAMIKAKKDKHCPMLEWED